MEITNFMYPLRSEYHLNSKFVKNMTEQFRDIYYKKQNDRIIPFLKELKVKDKKEIAKELKAISDKNKKDANPDAFWTATVICCTKTQFKALSDYYDIDITELADEALALHCPDWFSEIFNKGAEEEYWIYIRYQNLVRWQQKGYLQPSGKLIARSLANAVSHWSRKGKRTVHNSRALEQYPITLDEHIWTLFEHQTSIDWDDSRQYNENKESDIWKKNFLKYSQNGRIDRMRLLKACLNTVLYDFRRDLSGWYADLFIYLQLTEAELLTIQDELFATFMGKYPKMTNRVLDMIKKIAGHKDFHTADFITQTGLLLTSEVKSIVKSTLSILEKAAKSHKDKQAEICISLPLVFLNKDEAIQSKTAKIIVQYGDMASVPLKEALASYSNTILMSVKEILKDFLEETESIKAVNESLFEQLPIIDSNQQIVPPQKVDDLIFFLLHLFENGQPYQIDLLPATLIKLTGKINNTNLKQLELPLQKAYEICLSKPFYHMFEHKTNEFEKTYFWGTGSYENLAALFFVQYGQSVATKYPQEAGFIREMHNSAIEEDKRKAKKTKGGLFQYDRQITLLNEWINSKYKLFYAYHQAMLQALTFIEKGIRLPLLSTPTHLPCWIAPEILIERMEQYQSTNQSPNPVDLQLALARIAPESIPALIQLATEQLQETYNHPILTYYAELTPANKEKKSLFSVFTKEKTPCTFTGIKEFTASYSWKIADQKKTDSTYTERFVVEMTVPPSPWIKEENHYAGISDHLRLCIGTRDVTNFIFSYPATPAIPYAMIVKDRFEFAQMPNAEFRDFLTAAVAALFDIKVEIKSATSVFLACCMLCSEKTIRNYAAEIWIERTAGNLIDNIELGTHIGRLEKVEWAPVKRLTDQINDRLINISPKHNQALELLITSILSQIETPITNLKKLLEIYSELLAINQSNANMEKIPRLTNWAEENTLKKIVKQIII